MTRGGRKVVRTGPSYGFSHPDCRMAPPKGVDAKQTLAFDIELLGWVPADKVGSACDAVVVGWAPSSFRFGGPSLQVD